MESNITKIQFRQDSTTNWNNSSAIPASGEPCYDTTTGKVKVGNGKDTFNNLPDVGSEVASIGEPNDDGKKYARVRQPNEKVGQWQQVIEFEDARKTLADVLMSNGEEIDMNYMVDGNEVYGVRKVINITAEENTEVETDILENVSGIIFSYGTITTDTDHTYIIPSTNENYSANIVFDAEYKKIKVISKSNNKRDNSPIALVLIYTKQ